MSQIDWDRIVADADNEARKKVQKESENGQNSLDFISEPHVACCLLVDTSGSMQGSKIDELNRALQHFKKDVCADPLSAKRVDVCVVEFNSKAHGTHSTPSYTTTGIPFLSVKDMSSGKLNFSSCKFISNIKYKTQRTIFEMQS